MDNQEYREFLLELLCRTAELRQLVIDQCRLAAVEDDGHSRDDHIDSTTDPF
jgi:hypothetical protein